MTTPARVRCTGVRVRLSRRRACASSRPTSAAASAYAPPAGGRPRGLAPGLEATVYFDPPGPTFSGAVHVAVVERDRETGGVRVLKYVVVEDCGPVVNPMIVEGQVHGAALSLRAEALADARVPPT